MTHSFGLDAPSALEAFKNAAEKFKDDELNEDLARDCACKAWHLCDHVSRALDSNSPFASLRRLQDHVIRNCPELSYLKDICNASKHGESTSPKTRIEKAHLHRGAFNRGFSGAFDISRLEIELPSNQKVFFRDVVDRAVKFWSKFSDDNGIK